jgi:trigger factor
MLVNIEDKNEIEKLLHYSVEKAIVDSVISQFVEDIRPRVDVKGFRKGTAPSSVVRTHFKDIILAECSARIVNDTVIESIQLKSLKIVGAPNVIADHKVKPGKKHIGNFNLDGSFSFSLEADLEPAINVTMPEITISEKIPSKEELVQMGLRKIQQSMAQLNLVDRPATPADRVSVEFMDDKNSYASIAISDPEEVLHSNLDLVGKSAGDQMEVALLDGTAANITVKGVFAVTLPEINDDFAKQAMFGSLAEMISDIESKSSDQTSAPLRAKLYHEVLVQLVAANPINIPERWIDNEVKVVCSRIGLRELPANNPFLTEEVRKQADLNIKSNLILDAIYRADEKIHMSADESFRIVEAEAVKAKLTTDEALTHLRNSNQYDTLMSFHERNRTIDHLLSTASVKQEQV